ncbi:hypothetical protein DL89DRAFT_256608 [Linderina pennispora]|uniref:Arrestin-like N-terminal domain-containing protein n=1 Tax=Linderina pennispora TaxID=61395 RepID=A0A1Y1WDZ7_9FUNG|nr:uncharacterized protein DL89DRAFT_256608 [Linderina pennispora]ORX71625.1 hypothetical protein DL89DRAFT_256608 [Linderina pennispora]
MKPTSISIVLDTDTVSLFGERTQAAGHILTGKVVARFRTTTKVRSLDVSFTGEQAISFTPRPASASARGRQSPVTANRRLADISQQLVVPGADKSTATFSAGMHELRFELVLPGDLPPTANLLFGSISYTVRAKLTLTGLRSNCSAQTPVVVVRNPGEGSEWADASADALSASAEWEDKVKVTLARDSHIVADSALAQFTCIVEPGIKGLRLMALDLVLKEVQTVFRDAGHVPVHRETQVIARKRIAFGRQGSAADSREEHRVALNMPAAYEDVQFELQSDSVTVRHQVVLTALVKAPEGAIVEMTIPAYVSVLPNAGANGTIDLPLYESSGSDRLIQTSQSVILPGALSDYGAQSAGADSAVAVTRDLPPYSLPVCPSCGKEDVSVLQCHTAAAVRISRMPPNAEIEDLCAEL